MKRKIKSDTLRIIRTDYFLKNRIIKTTLSKNPNSASRNMFEHLFNNHYGAEVAQVVNDRTGRVYTEMKVEKSGKILTTYKYDPSNFATRDTLEHFKRIRKEIL